LAWGAPVNQEVAGSIAKNWAYLHGWHLQEAGWTPSSREAEPKVEFSGELKDDQNEVVAYKYRFPTGGEVVIINEDGLAPVFFYSETNTFDPNANPTVKYLFENMVAKLKFVRAQNTIPHAGWTSVASQAESYRSTQTPAKSLAASTVGPLVKTRWSQSPLYNKFCPEKDKELSVTGCTATAMAQILKYWELPSFVTPKTIEYTTDTEAIHVGPVDIASRPLNWVNMPIELTGSSSQTQVDAVAWLSYICGLTVEMDYSPSGSGGPTVSAKWPVGPNAEKAFQQIFFYGNVKGILRSSSPSWTAIMRDQIERGQPVLYSGYSATGGHAFVLDGVQDTPQGDLFHFNLGWGGNANDWYSTDGPLEYTDNQDAIIDIYQGIRYRLTVTISPEKTGAVMQAPTSENNAPIDAGTTVQLKAIPYGGYVFSHWTGDATGTDKTVDLTMDSDKAVTAVFIPGYKICMHYHGEGTVNCSPDADGFTSGTTVTMQAQPASGWMFDHWEGDVAGNTTSATITVSRDQIVHAFFVPCNYLLVVPTGQGTVTRNLNGPGYKPNTRVTLTATPAEGWVFRKWWGDVDSTENPIIVTANSNKVIQAEFVNPSLESYPLTINVIGNGQVFPFGGSFAKDSTVTLTATPAQGWKFVQWRGEIVSKTNPMEITMDKARCVTGVFIEENAQMPADETIQNDQPTSSTDPVATVKTQSTDSANSTDSTEKGGDFGFSNLIDSCTLLATVLVGFMFYGFSSIRVRD
jgi:hypothetical protein